MQVHDVTRINNRGFAPLALALMYRRFVMRRPKHKRLRNQIAMQRRKIKQRN